MKAAQQTVCTCDDCVRQPNHLKQQLQQWSEQLWRCADGLKQLLHSAHDDGCMLLQLLSSCRRHGNCEQQPAAFLSSCCCRPWLAGGACSLGSGLHLPWTLLVLLSSGCMWWHC